MHKNNFLKTISPTIRLICLILIVVSIILSKSLYLVLSITTFILMLCIYLKITVKDYVKFIENIALILVIFVALYIILFRVYTCFSLLIALYKTLLITLILKIFEMSINFDQMNTALHSLLFPLRKFNIEKYSYDIAMSLYFIKYIFESKTDIKDLCRFNGQNIIILKRYISIKLIYAINKLDKLKIKQKINYYHVKKEKINKKSILVLILFIIFFIVCIFKEVIF